MRSAAGELAVAKSRNLVLWIVIVGLIFACAGGAGLWLVRKRPGQSVAAVNDAARQSLPAALETQPKPAAPDLWKGLKPGAITIERSPNSRLVYAVATIKNDTDRQRFGVKVIVDVLNKEGETVGKTSDYTQFIDAHKEWTFKALVTDFKAAGAKIDSIAEE
jgi:hypothetical protein